MHPPPPPSSGYRGKPELRKKIRPRGVCVILRVSFRMHSQGGVLFFLARSTICGVFQPGCVLSYLFYYGVCSQGGVIPCQGGVYYVERYTACAPNQGCAILRVLRSKHAPDLSNTPGVVWSPSRPRGRFLFCNRQDHGRRGRRLVDEAVRDRFLKDLLNSYRRQHIIRDQSEYMMVRGR